tara:strand:+ start:234 stop:557 length:324 start_codon:yes stop_codon:yes gene_type:complete
MSSSLPWGVTDAMCEPHDPPCGNCGHLFSDHYYEDGAEKIYEQKPLNVAQDHEDQCIEYNADGERIHACDNTRGKTQEEKLRNQCDCTEFGDHEYEPDWDSMNEDLD